MRASTRSLVAACFGLGLALVLTLAASITGLAQSDNTQISGFVKDQNGAVIAGAKVTVRSETKIFERTSTTSSEGYFIVTTLPPGLYTVSVEAQGFKQYKETGRKLDPNIAASVEISLQAGQLTETVQITASTVAIQTESSTVGKLIEGKQLEALQLNGRNPLFLALLKPGVSGGALGGFSFGLTNGGLNINGANPG
ncbi:MAG: carboxypeptidase regulatory-like domain-containing protein [Acidobacteria bacterium]|nr:carboxypeptidase regulatory-like domain-containing protein [Acidobacteriota bacterium]